MSIFERVFGSPSQSFVKTAQKRIDAIHQAESRLSSLSDADIQAQTARLKERAAAGESLDDLLPEAFATVREASRRLVGTSWSVRGSDRAWDMVPFDVQLIGAMALHAGRIAEMKTGEGKTLVATLAVYLNALAGRGVHVVTVNEYLAQRDLEWMGGLYRFLGLTVGSTLHGQSTDEKRAAYAADITYGTNNEFGFDYLRDNMVVELSQRVQRPLSYAIVDEVDSILIDEARTPLIISAPDVESGHRYRQFSAIIPRLSEGADYNVDEKLKAVAMTDAGMEKVEQILGIKNLYAEGGVELVHHLETALKAATLYLKDRDYIIKDGEVLIVDEFTGRLMPGRRYSEGLHQAIEAKENVEVQRESKTLATITFQNYFRLYPKLAGMTGTALTEAEEFYKIYGLDVVEIPTNKAVARNDMPDRVYATVEGKLQAIVEVIDELHRKGQPVLVGTVSIEKNELLSDLLTKHGVPHEVLNAKQHEREAHIIERAGQQGAVTIATNLAGRGTDIKLGEGVRELGGLFVLGTERHESRRIDNQLRGRSGRQGDPGASQFYVSLQDDLMRLFGSERISGLMQGMGMQANEAIENRMISRSIESAQKKVEGHNFDIRKHVVEYDDVLNRQREVIYRRRDRVLAAWELCRTGELPSTTLALPDEEKAQLPTLFDQVHELIESEVEQLVSFHAANGSTGGGSEPNIEELLESVKVITPLPTDARAEVESLVAQSPNDAALRTTLTEFFVSQWQLHYTEAETKAGADTIRSMERAMLLRTIDSLWIEHLDAMDHLRESVRLRGYGQRDPLVEYKREGFGQFQKLLDEVQHVLSHSILHVAKEAGAQQEQLTRATTQLTQATSLLAQAGARGGITLTSSASDQSGAVTASADATNTAPTAASMAAKTPGRNDPCFCGSGKKYKKCHGA